MDRISKSSDLKIDVIVTSPPYNIGKKYNVYNDRMDELDYLNWLYEIAQKSYSILKFNGSFFLNIGETSTDPLIPFQVVNKFLNAGYKLQNTIHWIKSISIEKEDMANTNPLCSEGFSIGHYKPIRSNRFLTNIHEYVFHFTKSGYLPIDKLSIGVPYQDKSNVKRWKSVIQDRKDRGNVWFVSYPTIQRERSHPAIFPEKLAKLCIKLHGCNSKDSVVYDPFMGIGSTALACMDLGIDFIGTEIDLNYVKYAKEVIGKKKIFTNK